ncbi:hypothetical protein LTR53_002813 [Teratosphaeriaceae sp. CCFEE 6253]|nr:hypothetical protein LTR53_002813 [Teratosphaeriaceae sp. CCFEE 6253]
MDREGDLTAFVNGSCWSRSEQHEAGLREIDALDWGTADKPTPEVRSMPIAPPRETDNKDANETVEVPEGFLDAEASTNGPRPASEDADDCSTLISDLHDVASLQHQIDTQLAAELRQDGIAEGQLPDSTGVRSVTEDAQTGAVGHLPSTSRSGHPEHDHLNGAQRSEDAEDVAEDQSTMVNAPRTLQAHQDGVPATAVHPSPTAVSDDGPEALQHDSPRQLSSTRSSPDPLQGPPTKMAKLDGSRRRPGSSADGGVAGNRKAMMAPPIPPLARASESAPGQDPGHASTAQSPPAEQGLSEVTGALEVDDSSLAASTSARLRSKTVDPQLEMAANSSDIATSTGTGRGDETAAKKPKSIGRVLQALASTSVGTKISPKLRTRTQTKAVAQSKPSEAAKRRHSGK